MSEEKRIMDLLGRPEIDGEVRGKHLGKVLTYLKTMKNEEWDKTISKLSLVLGMNSRYIRENYLKGLLYFDIIKLYRNSNALYWQWVGESALKGSVIPTEPEQVINDLLDIENQETEETKEVAEPEETKEGCCPNCGKKLKKNTKFCSEECLKKYYEKKKGEKTNE